VSIKKQKKFFSIMIIPYEDSNVRSFRVSYLTVRIVFFFCLLLLAGALVLLLNQKRLVSLAAKASLYEQKNVELMRRNALILELAERVDKMESLYEQIGGMLGTSVEFSKPGGGLSYAPAETSLPAGEIGVMREEGKTVPGDFDREATIDNEGVLLSGWPLTVRGYITRQFSMTNEKHPGIDIAVPRNTPVKATGDGVVTEARYDPIYGNYVVINHGNRLSTFYAHNSRICVREGQRVQKDEVIAFSGSTGRSTAPHLHYELRKQNVPVDPQKFLR
jgi:murein DD-endopeptidase MepM/ murein hydrolase activator NlpD